MEEQTEIPVFVDTNLGTRFSIPVSPHITVAHFKREVEKAHIDIFPELGFLCIHAVKRNTNFYCLPDSLPLKLVCQGFENFWFLHVDASLSDKLGKISPSSHLVPMSPSYLQVKNGNRLCKKSLDKIKQNRLRRIWCLRAVLQGLAVTAYMLRKKKKKKTRHKVKKVPAGSSTGFLEKDVLCQQGAISGMCRKERNNQLEKLAAGQQSDSTATAESLRGCVSEATDVSGIINRYFTNFIEEDQGGSDLRSYVAPRTCQKLLVRQHTQTGKTISSKLGNKKQDQVHTANTKLMPSALTKDVNSIVLRTKYERSEVGERLVRASNSLGLCQSKQYSPGCSLLMSRRLLNPEASTLVRTLVFEINDND